MPKAFFKQKNKTFAALCTLALSLVLAACAGEPAPVESASPPVPTAAPEVSSRDADKIVISELMLKNRAVLRDEDGDFSDWIELENISSDSVALEGWRLSDRDGEPGWALPPVTLSGGERLLIFASGKDRQSPLHTDFSLSAGETLSLYNAAGYQVQRLLCPETEGDESLSRERFGTYAVSQYPTPGRANIAAEYDALQGEQEAPGPLVINEACVSNFTYTPDPRLGLCDWVEIKNISGEVVELSDYYLSDDREDYRLWRFPEGELAPGALLLVCCDDSGAVPSPGTVLAPFALNSTREELYLSGPDYALTDWASLRDIPYQGSFGRMEGENGWFFFAAGSPGQENAGGCRRVSAMPSAAGPDGVFENVDSVTVELSGPGTVYYTTDCSVPTPQSPVYEGPLSLTETSVLRAVCVEEGALPSRPLTLSYIINEGHSLPVLSLVSNDRTDFNVMYSAGIKGLELPGNLALYEENGSFNIPCGVRMYGETSLSMPKKNMSVRFRGAYGQEALSYDAFGGGVTEFTNFVLRSGQDFYRTVIRNELGLNLGLQFSDNIMSLRSKYCVLYTDGEYSGIYALSEKSNEQHYASLAGVSRDSVTVLEANVSAASDMWEDVFLFCLQNDMAEPGNYAHFCQMVDVDSVIDWLVVEGLSGNTDLRSGNLRYCRSTENDGKWRFMLYDLDATFSSPMNIFANLFSQAALDQRQLVTMLGPLLKNEDFVDRLLTRTGEALNTVYTPENIASELDRLAAQVRPELARDYARFSVDTVFWERNLQTLRDSLTDGSWQQQAIEYLRAYFRLSEEETEKYFGQGGGGHG